MPSRIQRELALLVTGKDVSATKTLRGVNRELNTLSRIAGKAGTNISRNLQRGLLIGATAAAGAFGYAVKQAIAFEDAFAGVRKTVEGSPAELARLYVALRDIATRVPVDFTDIAAIAAEAGALGVPTKQIAKFTEVVARLASSTVGLTAEAAAEAFGKFRNVLKLTDPEIERAGSALVALGNAGASSEGDIIEVAKRFGAAGHQAQLSAAQVLGWASAIASLGVEPEAAGSSLSRLFNNITKYIGTGSGRIKAFSATAKLSVADFSRLFAKDASGAVQTFLGELGKMDRFKAAKVLKAAGITNVRDINAVLLLAQNTKELRRQVDLSSKAFKDNTELARVSAARYASTANQIHILENNAKDAAVTIGTELLPEVMALSKEGVDWLHGHQPEIAQFARELAGHIRDAVTWARGLDWAAIGNAMKAGASFAQTMVDAFVNAPPWLQQFLAVGFVANKFTGGAVMDVVGELAKGLIKGVLGITAAVVNVNAGVVNGGGGVPGVGGGAGGAGGALLGLGAGPLALAGLTVGAIAAGAIFAANAGPNSLINRPGGHVGPGDLPGNKIQSSIAEVGGKIDEAARKQQESQAANRRVIEEKGAESARLQAQIRDLTATTGQKALQGGQIAAQAIIGKQMSTTVNVSVSTKISARDLVATVTRQNIVRI